MMAGFVIVEIRDGSNEVEGLAGSVHSPVKAYNSQPKFGRTFVTRLRKLRYKIISE